MFYSMNIDSCEEKAPQTKIIVAGWLGETLDGMVREGNPSLFFSDV